MEMDSYYRRLYNNPGMGLGSPSLSSRYNVGAQLEPFFSYQAYEKLTTSCPGLIPVNVLTKSIPTMI